jgi:hypothetical protein
MKKIIRIGPLDWTFDDNVTSKSMKKSELGTCAYEDLEIKIKGGLKTDVRKVTVLHELLHAMFSCSGYTPKDEENIVDILANQLLLFIKNNPDFFKEHILESPDPKKSK